VVAIRTHSDFAGQSCQASALIAGSFCGVIDPSIPLLLEFPQVLETLVLVPEVMYPKVRLAQDPFGEISMLENSIAFEIMLTHRVFEWMYRHRRHRIGLAYFPESHVKRIFGHWFRLILMK
jgi:hypothetical protein